MCMPLSQTHFFFFLILLQGPLQLLQTRLLDNIVNDIAEAADPNCLAPACRRPGSWSWCGSRIRRIQSASTIPISSQLGAVSSLPLESSGAANPSPSGSHDRPPVSGSVTLAISTLATVATSQQLGVIPSTTVVGSSGTLFGSLRHGI